MQKPRFSAGIEVAEPLLKAMGLPGFDDERAFAYQALEITFLSRAQTEVVITILPHEEVWNDEAVKELMRNVQVTVVVNEPEQHITVSENPVASEALKNAIYQDFLLKAFGPKDASA